MDQIEKNSLKKHRQQDRRIGKETFEIVKDYSEYSTIQGVLYIFQTNQTTFGKIFWISVVAFMFILGAFWSQFYQCSTYSFYSHRYQKHKQLMT
jgi:hypothetical protein